MTTPMTVAESAARDEWSNRAMALRAEGCDWFGSITAIDDPDAQEIELVLAVGRSDRWELTVLSCRVPRGDASISSLASVWAGAEFAEREVAEMVGVTFLGHPDPRPLLLPSDFDAHPLRRDVGLARRANTPWPGAHEPGEGSRRRPTRAIGSDSTEWSESL